MSYHHVRGECRLPGGGVVEYDLRGEREAEPIVLLPPVAGGMRLWGELREALADELWVVSLSHRGSGRSSRAPLLSTTRRMAADVVRLLDELGMTRVHVFGESFGGMVALRMALDRPERVVSLAIAGAAATGLPHGPSAALHSMLLAACLVAPRQRVQPCMVRRVLASGRLLRPRAHLEAIESQALGLPPRRVGFISLTLAALRHDVRGELPRIAQPTLVIGGTLDRITPPRVQRDLARAIRGAELLLLEAGHRVSFDKPSECAAAVVSHVHDAVARERRKQVRLVSLQPLESRP